MPAEKKNELLKRRRQSYHANKVTSTIENDDREQSTPRNGEMGSTQSEMPKLGGAPTEQGNHSVVVKPCSSACNKENMPPRSKKSLNIYQSHDNIMCCLGNKFHNSTIRYS